MSAESVGQVQGTDARTETANGGAPLYPKRWVALFVLLVATFMDLLDATIVNVALPRIQQTLDAEYSSIQWVTAGYALAFALLLITGGRLGDIYGRRRMFLFGVAGFTVASLLCGIAAEPWHLVAARVLQGATAAVMIPQVLAIIHVTFPKEERGKAFGLFGAIGGLAAILGMVLGGVLTDLNILGLEWRPIFLINVPIGIYGLVAGWRAISESKSPHPVKLDPVGIALVTVAMLLLLLPLTRGHELGWPAWTFASMVLALVVLAGFVVFERRKMARDGSPLVPLSLFRLRSFVSGVSVFLLFNIAMGIFFIAWAIYMQVGLGWSPMRAGLSGVPFCLGAAPGAGISVGVLLPKIGRKVVQLGAGLMAIGLGWYALMAAWYGADIAFWQVAPPLFVLGVGFGFVSSCLAAIAVADVPGADAGAASGLFNTQQQLGAAIGIALSGVVFLGGLSGQLTANGDEFTPQVRQELVAVGVADDRAEQVATSLVRCASLSAGRDVAAAGGPCAEVAAAKAEPEVARVLDNATRTLQGEAFSDAFRIAVWSIIGVMLLAFLVMFGLPKGKINAAETPDTAVPA